MKQEASKIKVSSDKEVQMRLLIGSNIISYLIKGKTFENMWVTW